ncbi:hypothetical protein QF047_004242 [Arthrobacter sp. W4I7]|nr:hypothetical protein [Arthrobacter sp. W4I7]
MVQAPRGHTQRVIRSRFTVSSPSSTATTTEPSLGSIARLTISSSPSLMPARSIESPVTRTTKCW